MIGRKHLGRLGLAAIVAAGTGAAVIGGPGAGAQSLPAIPTPSLDLPVPTPSLPMPSPATPTPSLPVPSPPSPSPTIPITPQPQQPSPSPGEPSPTAPPSPTAGETPANPTTTPGGTPTTSPSPTTGSTPGVTGGGQQETTRARERATQDPLGQALSGKLRTPDGATRLPDGTPTIDNPGFALATPGAAPIGVPNFFIEKFRIPPFLLPIYQAAGIQYGVRWEVLAAINEIETDYGRNLNVSYAGAVGWMQFMPATWEAYGVDANRDGVKDPYNPVDAIFAAARYLRAAGADQDLSRAIFAYNHADWYVESVLLRARVIGGIPADLVGSLTGLTQGHFPVYGKATYADDLSDGQLRGRRAKAEGNAAFLVESETDRRGIHVFARPGTPVVAVNDGRIVRVGSNKRFGNFVELQDVYGNTYTYAHLGEVVSSYPRPKERDVSKEQVRRELDLPRPERTPSGAASTTRKAAGHREAEPGKAGRAAARQAPAATDGKERLFANPGRPRSADAGGSEQLLAGGARVDGYASLSAYLKRVFGLKRDQVEFHALKRGTRVVAGTILGRVGKTQPALAPHLLFEIRPAGRGAPRIDPKPILDGWKLLESTALYRAAGKNPFFGSDAETPTIGQILLMSKEALAERVAANPRIQLYECGSRDVETGQIDRRVLATLEFLAASGMRPTVTSLKCGHSVYTASGNISHHSSGNAVDIAAVNGIPILGHQGSGSITEMAVQRLLTLQGTMKPDQIITLMQFAGTDNTFAMGDHHDHIHVGWRPLYGENPELAKHVNAILKPDQWIKLIARLNDIDNPVVRTAPSKYAIKVQKPASHAHRGE